MVEYSSHNPKIEGLTPITSSIGRDKNVANSFKAQLNLRSTMVEH
jgi:hypothetical protein